MNDDKLTHFGYQHVKENEKANKVASVFNNVSSRYDLMNDLMSLGLHRIWKKIAIAEANIREHHIVLDLASGTGDLILAMTKIIKSGLLLMSDINEAMLNKGRDRLIDQLGILPFLRFLLIDAENIPLQNNSIDRITIAFGLRNVTNKEKAILEMYRVLKPGGKIMILEFSKPTLPLLNSFYDQYSFKIIPKLGKFILDDEESYQYLVESIRMHPTQETLKSMLENLQFEDVAFRNLAGGIVAIHTGWKY